ncbi:MAG: serine hydrolase, partial [Cyanobacteria bacterium J06555_3]
DNLTHTIEQTISRSQGDQFATVDFDHKTGDIKSVLADVGIIDMPSGKRYIASILVKRPDNSPQAQEFIQKASRTAYQYFKTPQTTSFTLKDES